MLTLILLSGYSWIGNLAITSKAISGNQSISRYLYTSILLFLFQIFVTVSFLGFFPSGLKNGYLISLNFCISTFLLLVSYKDFKNDLDLYRRRLISLKANFQVVLAFILIAIMFGEILFLILKAYYFPNYVWDEMVYHLHPVVVWNQEQMIKFTIDSPSPWVNSENLGSKRLVYWLFTFLGYDTFVNSTQIFGISVLLLSVYRFLRIVGTSILISLCAAMAVLNLPLVLIQANTNQEHVNLAAFTFVMMLIPMEKYKYSLVEMILLIVAIILMLSAKTSAVLHLLVFVPFIIFLKFKQIRNLLSNHAISFVTILSGLVAVLVSILVKFNIMSLIIASSGFDQNSGLSIWEKMLEFINRHFEIFIKNFRIFPIRMMDKEFTYFNADSDSISSFGPFFISFGLFGIFFALLNLARRKDKNQRKLDVLFLFSILLQLIYFSFYFSPWNYRLFILFSIISICLGFYYSDKIKLNNVAIFLLTIMLSGFCFVSTSISDYASPKRMRNFISTLKLEERSTINYYRNLKMESWVFISEYLENEEPIAYIASDDEWIYPYFNTDWKRKIHYIKHESFKSISDNFIEIDENKLSELKSKGVRIIHARSRTAPDGKLIVVNSSLSKIADSIYFIH